MQSHSCEPSQLLKRAWMLRRVLKRLFSARAELDKPRAEILDLLRRPDASRSLGNENVAQTGRQVETTVAQRKILLVTNAFRHGLYCALDWPCADWGLDSSWEAVQDSGLHKECAQILWFNPLRSMTPSLPPPQLSAVLQEGINNIVS